MSIGQRQVPTKIRPLWIDLSITSILYGLALLVPWRDLIPPGLGNDAAEEALRGILLIEGGRFEPITFSIGNSTETLYLYLLGLVIKVFGSTTLALQILSASFAVACVCLVCILIRRIDSRLPTWISIVLTASSIWLFHYGRSGLRAISAPVFLLAFVILICLGEEEKRRFNYLWGFLAGLVLGLSVYAYTSCRALAVAALVYMVVRLISGPDRIRLFFSYLWLSLGAILISIPNLIFLVNFPQEFLNRGNYVLSGQAISIPRNLIASLLLPIHYLYSYRGPSSPSFDVDGFSSSLVVPGLNPINPIVSVLMIVGLVKAWPMIGKKREIFLLMIVWLVSTLILGVAGPSLTRFLLLLPVYVIFAILAFGRTETVSNGITGHIVGQLARVWPLAQKGQEPILKLVSLSTVTILALLLASSVYSYFFQFGSSEEIEFYYSPVATPMGTRAYSLAEDGKRVLCVVAKDRNIVHYLTYPVRQSVEIVEFYYRPFDPAEISSSLSKADVILVEKDSRFQWFSDRYPIAETNKSLKEERFNELVVVH